MSEYSGKWDIPVCGLNCAKCDIYEAGHGDDRLRDEMVERFKKERSEDVKPEQITCEGCRGPFASHWSQEFGMMQCAGEKEVQHHSE